ncbi:hypothetical protein [Syntrophomonas palmitatica]|uniref:hypothetical protein n=1 Tax=Syntrophomonas palmitatica TaxID=402877 RepID=UPI0006D0F94A|nr:hypothetical protein [Syntrophomonas palmitatica]
MQANRFYIDIAIQQEMLFETAQANLQRFQPFAAVIIGIESVLLILLLVYSQVSASFKYSWYAFMYLLMIIITGLTWIFFSRLRHKLDHGLPEIKMLDLAIIIYLCFLMTWGAVISLIDQDLYGNIAAFLINLLAGSFMFYVNPKRIMIPLFLSGLVLFIGLPVFQPSRDVLVGHYTNATIFIVLSCWLPELIIKLLWKIIQTVKQSRENHKS